MALFIVLWMMNSSKAVKQSITGYFRDPKGYSRHHGAGPATPARDSRCTPPT
jgi:chemotaxis protein MotB